MPKITFTAPPTCARFMKSEAFVRILMGPVGSGKTTTCIFEMLRRAMEQAPCSDGLRHTRFAIVRQTLEQLRMTVLKDIEEWLRGIVSYKVSEKTIYVSFGDVRSEWLLIPLEDPEDQKRLLSSQLTGAWMSECIEINVDLVSALLGRLGRYPSKGQRPPNFDPDAAWPTWHGLIGDTNFPTIGSDWHRTLELQLPIHWQVFKQPGGLDPNAENIENLPGGREYYKRLAEGQNEDWIKRYVHAEYGSDPAGSAVFRSAFKREFHVTSEVTPALGYPLIISQDFGRNPCALITQVDHRGRLLVLEEVVCIDMGLEIAVTQFLRPALAQSRYAGYQFYFIGDPAGAQRSTTYEESSFDFLKRVGFHGHPAPTNSIDKRLRAVEAFMLGSNGGGPNILIDGGRCPKLVEALSGMYRYAKRKSGQLAPLPDKNHPWSDLADALQYAALAAHGGYTDYVINKQTRARTTTKRASIPVGAWT